MNETLKTISTRYSCRNFTNKMPSDEDLRTIAHAAIEAPSAMNRQKWRVIIVKDSALISEIDAEGMRVLKAASDQSGYERIMSRGGALLYHTPVMAIVPIESPADSRTAVGFGIDCGIVCQNIALAATSLGLSSDICAMAGLAFSPEKAAYFKERLGFPAGYEFGISVLLGYAAASGSPHSPDESKISFIN